MTTTTDEKGAYQFVGLAPASYRVVIVDPDKGDLAGLIPTQAYTGRGATEAAVTITDASVQGVDFSTLSSVKSGRVYSTGLGMWNWFTPNPDSPIVANWIGASLYPEQFSDVDLVSMTKDYYQKMYNFTLTDEQARAIVNPDAAS